MVLLRRYLLRLLRLRNLLACTIIVILLYIVKKLGEIEGQGFSSGDPVKAYLWSFDKKQDYFVPSSKIKIDWHNYKKIEEDAKRVGIGEQGKPAKLPKEKASLEEKLYSVNGFNAALSDEIPLNRSLPDIRHPDCKSILYLQSLPTVSVVVPFHNEHWSTLLRTAYTVLHRSPEHLIKEVFLVDDASNKEFLKDKLDAYLAANMPKVSVVRLATRSGLITARLAGAERATGDVLIFLDSHTEANVNWLPPLLEPIALNHRVVVCPFIDVIAFDTFEYRAQDEGARGAFDWEFFYKRLPVLPKDLMNMPEPFESPVMAGGLFAISRAYFWELGGYDPGLDIWGGEQYELSFKHWQPEQGQNMSMIETHLQPRQLFPEEDIENIWQCGGRMLDAPCSRVGHIYRKFAPFPNPGHGDFVGKNYRRVAEVWMDEYAEYLYMRRPQYRKIDPGNLTEQLAVRRRLQCKPFKWFITQIAFDLPGKYPPIEPGAFANGKVRPVKDKSLCVDANHGQRMAKVLLAECAHSPNAEQEFLFSWHKDVKSKDRNMCWDVPDSTNHSPVVLYTCHLGGGNQHWRFLSSKKQIRHGSGKCLDWDVSTRALFVNECDETSTTQQWTIDTVDEKMLAKWDDMQERITAPLEPWLEDVLCSYAARM